MLAEAEDHLVNESTWITFPARYYALVPLAAADGFHYEAPPSLVKSDPIPYRLRYLQRGGTKTAGDHDRHRCSGDRVDQ